LCFDGIHFTRGEKAQFYIYTPGADGLGAGSIVSDDEILDAIQIGEVFFSNNWDCAPAR
jgi:intergrase/recombinase